MLVVGVCGLSAVDRKQYSTIKPFLDTFVKGPAFPVSWTSCNWNLTNVSKMKHVSSACPLTESLSTFRLLYIGYHCRPKCLKIGINIQMKNGLGTSIMFLEEFKQLKTWSSVPSFKVMSWYESFFVSFACCSVGFVQKIQPKLAYSRRLCKSLVKLRGEYAKMKTKKRIHWCHDKIISTFCGPHFLCRTWHLLGIWRRKV
jgi:hypothetical protein